MLLMICKPATTEQLNQMSDEFYGLRIKVAVDTARRILAGGGSLHYDCEEALLNGGSNQQDIWGADWYPTTKIVEFDSLINLRPSQGNRSTAIENSDLRIQVESIVRHLLEIT